MIFLNKWDNGILQKLKRCAHPHASVSTAGLSPGRRNKDRAASLKKVNVSLNWSVRGKRGMSVSHWDRRSNTATHLLLTGKGLKNWLK